jgi:hypothetical protein
MFAADDRVRTWYDALQLQIERPLRAGTRWGGGLAYTLSKSEERGQQNDLFWGFDDRYPTVADLPRRQAPGDQRHAIVANLVTLLPADIRLSSIVNLATGIAVSAVDASGGTGRFDERLYIFQPPTRPFLGMGHVFATQNLDLRLEKGFTVAGGQRVSVSADLFNAFNSGNFGCFGDNARIPIPADQNEEWRRRYGTPTCAAPGRRLQVGLRYGFSRAP